MFLLAQERLRLIWSSRDRRECDLKVCNSRSHIAKRHWIIIYKYLFTFRIRSKIALQHVFTWPHNHPTSLDHRLFFRSLKKMLIYSKGIYEEKTRFTPNRARCWDDVTINLNIFIGGMISYMEGKSSFDFETHWILLREDFGSMNSKIIMKVKRK